MGLADVAHRVEAVGHMLGQGGVLVAPALQAVDGDPLPALVEEELDHALADPGVGLAADMALGRGVVIVGNAHVTVGPDLALDSLATFLGVPGQGLEERPLACFEQGAPGLAARHGACFSRSSSRRIAAFIASSEKKDLWRSTSGMRD